MTAQSQSASVGAAAVSYVWTPYYPTIIVTNPSTTLELFVRTDGTAAVANAANNQAVPPSSNAILGNQLPLPQAEGINVLGLLSDPLHATQVSVIASGAGPTEVTVTVQ